ncbi:hypothetical protein LTR53_009363 [Teratosphaeriaceae sp. CCFEE 6253]|nr:hypothetical protein LTR53_009363 [Teratosphaeriaceae sp. CCFEE 6253]
MASNQRGKEMLIVATRGAEKLQPRLLAEDIRDARSETWEHVKAASKASCSFDSDDDDEDDPWFPDDSGTQNTIVDAYRHVDEYTWPPSHYVKDH